MSEQKDFDKEFDEANFILCLEYMGWNRIKEFNGELWGYFDGMHQPIPKPDHNFCAEVAEKLFKNDHRCAVNECVYESNHFDGLTSDMDLIMFPEIDEKLSVLASTIRQCKLVKGEK